MNDARCVYRINLAQLKDNFAYLKSCAGNCRLMPVLKYNAYGMGYHAVGTALKNAGAYRFAAATLDEALELQTLGLEVMILGLLPPWEVAPAVAAGIICPIDCPATAEMISREAVRQQKKVSVAIKLDTGMGRLGIPVDRAAQTVAEIVKLLRFFPTSPQRHSRIFSLLRFSWSVSSR